MILEGNYYANVTPISLRGNLLYQDDIVIPRGRLLSFLQSVTPNNNYFTEIFGIHDFIKINSLAQRFFI